MEKAGLPFRQPAWHGGGGGPGVLPRPVRTPYKAAPDGEVPERSIGTVSKTVVLLVGTEGSNPSLSAT